LKPKETTKTEPPHRVSTSQAWSQRRHVSLAASLQDKHSILKATRFQQSHQFCYWLIRTYVCSFPKIILVWEQHHGKEFMRNLENTILPWSRARLKGFTKGRQTATKCTRCWGRNSLETLYKQKPSGMEMQMLRSAFLLPPLLPAKSWSAGSPVPRSMQMDSQTHAAEWHL
jgi:hypothetical protein